MGATASSAQRDSRCEEDAAAEELTAAASGAQDDGDADDKLLQKNGQISSLNVKTRSHADELNGNLEERALADVGSGFVTLKEDGTETVEELQEMDALKPVTKNESTEIVNADSPTAKEETVEDNQVNDINEVGFKKIFRFVGFKFTLKKDTCEKTETNEPEENVASASEDSKDTQETSAVEANENTDETQKSEVSSQPDAAEPSQQTDNEKELNQDIKIVEHHVDDTPEKELAKEETPEPEEPMSPIKQFFTQGIFASLRKKKKEEEIQKESKEEELKRIDKMGVEEAEKEDTKCMCLDIPYIMSEEEKDSQEKDTDKLLPEGDLQNSLEKDKVQGSPLKRLFRKFSTRRQKAAEKMIESEEQVSEKPKPSSELTEFAKVEEPVDGEPKPAEEELVADVSPQESKKKSDTTVSWEALICGGSAKKRARKTNEDETPDKGEENEKTTDSPLGSSIEGDYDPLTSSNEQTGSPAEGEVGSTWKTFKKMVTPKRKIRTGESSTPEQIPSDSEMNKDEPFSMKKLIPGHKKRKSDARKEQTTSDAQAAQDHETGDEDDETPAIIPLSEYEIIEPESLKEVNEQRVEITIEHEMPEMTSQVLEPDTSDNLVPIIAAKVPISIGPAIIHGLPEDFEELTDFVSKHQQLSDIPEEGIIEESIETPVSSAEWTTQDGTLAEDIVELTADAVTAPEPPSELFFGDDTTEMVSAVSQLTESPKSSGNVTPVSAEYGIQTSDIILQEAIQSICMTPSVQSVTTKDESQESLAVSFSPYIIQSSTLEETKVLVAHKKTEATAICIGLVSQEIEPVEEHLPAPLVEAIPEVSDAVPTELASDKCTDKTEIAGIETDYVYEAEIKEVNTEYQEVIVNEKESVIEIELSAEQVKESEETRIEDKREECTTGIETMQSAGLVQVMSDYTHGETERPLRSVLEEQPVAAEPEKKLTLPDVELSSAEFEQPAPTEVVESLTQGDVDNIPDTTTSKVKDTEIIASATECPETKETISIVSPISDHIRAETLKSEESIKLEEVESNVDVKDAVILTGESAVSVEDISEKMEEKDYNKETHVEEETAVVDEAENISEAGDSLARELLLVKEVSLPELVLVEEAKELHKEDTDTNLDNKVEDSVTEQDGIFVKEEHAVKKGQHLTNTDSNETEIEDVSAHTNTTSESPKIIFDAGHEIGDMDHGIREHTVVPEGVSVHIETPEEPEASSEVILKPLEMVLPEVEAKTVATETMVSQTEDWSEDTKPSLDLPKEIEEPATTENIKSGKVLEMVAIIENTTKQLIVSEQVTQAKSKLPAATEQEGEAIDNDQVPVMTSSEIKETEVSEEQDTMATAAKPEPEESDSGLTMIEVAAAAVQAHNYTATEIEVSKMSEQKNEADENVRLKCEPLEQVREKTLSNELHVDKTEIPAVMEITPIEPPLTYEITAEMPEVAVSEIQTQVVSELRAETLEVTEPKVEIPVVTEVKVETAVVTELEVETPVVTSVVAELELETPVVTSTAKTNDTDNSAVTSQNQNIDTDASVFKEQVVEIPTVISVVVTPPTPLDEVTSIVTLGNESKAVPPVNDTPVVTVAVETPNVESVIVRTAVAPVVEIQNVIAVATSDLGSVIVTEAASPLLSTTTVTTVAETTVVETPVFSVTAVKSTSAVVEKTVVSSVVEIPATVTSVVETPDVVSVAETVPPEKVTLDIKPTVVAVAQTPITEIPAVISATVAEVVSPVVVTSVVTSAAGAPMKPVVETPAQISIIATDDAPSVTPAATLALVTPIEIPAVETPVVKSPPVTVVETPAVTPVVQTPGQVSVIVTETTPSVVVSAEIAAVKTQVEIPVVETPVVKSPPVAVVETSVVTPVIQTSGQVSVMVTETAPSVIFEAPVEIPVVETPSVKSTSVAVEEIPVVQTSDQIKETLPPVVVSAETAAVKTPVAIPVVGTPVIKSTPVAVVETPVVTPVAQTSGQVLKESAAPVVVSAVAAPVETPVVIPVVKTPVVKSTAVAVVETPGQISEMASETAAPVVVSTVRAAVETPIVKSTPDAVVGSPVVTPVVQTPAQVSVMVTETAAPVVVSTVTAAVETPIVKSTPAAVVGSPVVTPVIQTPAQVSVMVTETAAPVVVSTVTAAVETPIAKSTPAVVVGSPVVTPVIQTPDHVSVMVTESAAPVVVSTVTAGVETPIVKSTPNVVVGSTVVTPVIQTPGHVSVMVTETAAPVVISTVTAAVETPIVKSTPVAVVGSPVVTPVVQTPGQVSVMVKESAASVVVSAVTAPVETPVMIPVVETPFVKSIAVALVETPVVTPVVQTPGQVAEMVREAVTPVVVSAVAAIAETPVMNPVVESPVVKPAPIVVDETPSLAPVAQTPCHVLVAVTEATPPVVASAVTAAAETPVVIPVVETPNPVVVAETPFVNPVIMTPTVTPKTERSAVSLVLETTAEAPTAIEKAERPVMIPVVQTTALVSVIAKETAPPVVLPPVTAAAETLVVAMAETPVPGPKAPAVIPAVQTVAEQVAQIPTTPAKPLVKATSVVTGMEAPAVTAVEKAQQDTPVAKTPAVTPVMIGPATASAVVATPPVVAPEVSKDVKPPFVAATDVKTLVLTEECISDKENGKASLPHEPAVTSTEPQSEVEEDVWEDAVDNIGDSLCQVTHTEGAPQDTAAKQASDAAI